MKRSLILLLPVMLLLMSEQAAAQRMKKAPEYRTSTWWQLSYQADEESDPNIYWVNVVGDTLAWNKPCWLLELTDAPPDEDRLLVRFLVEKSDLSILAIRFPISADWERYHLSILRFPMKPGAVYFADLDGLDKYAYRRPADEPFLCKVISCGEWEEAKPLADGSKPVRWTVQVIAKVEDSERKFMFPVTYFQPEPEQGFPGSCPVEFYFQIVDGFKFHGGGTIRPGLLRLLQWQW